MSGRRHLRALLGGAVLVAAIWLLPDLPVADGGGASLALGHGRIVSVGAVDPDTYARTAEVLILDGPRAGETVVADLGGAAGAGGPGASFDDPGFAPGDEVILQVSTTPEGELVAVADRWRVPLLGAVAGVFAGLVILVAGWRGLRALLALALTVATVVKLLLPALIAGWDPVLLAVGTGSAVTLATLILTEGARRSTVAAVIGTAGALLATALVAALATGAARFSILQGSEEIGFLRGLTGLDVELGGLLLASVILGALGVLDDVTITQAVTVEELARSDPGASRATIAGRAMIVGRAHIAATVNTLVLAYVAASLPLLLLFSLAPQPLGALASSEVVAVEVIRALVGSIAIVLAVPFTTFVAAWLVEPHDPGAEEVGAPA